MKIQAVLATHNQGKLLELQSALAPLGWDLRGLADFGLPAPEETGATFEANALLKATAAATATGLWALADDSGLEVAALGGAPGVDTAHYGGWEVLLEALKDVPEGQRQARFVCVLSLVRPGEEALTFKGTCEGVITFENRGTQGFGYDPVFAPAQDALGRTFAEMAKSEKAGFSHRGMAVNALLDWAQKLAHETGK